MISVASAAYAKTLIGVSPRKIWLSQEGDIVVTPRPIEEPFKNYACNILGIDPDKVVTLSPEGYQADLLPHAIRRSGMINDLRALIAERPGIDILCFALDRPTLELVEELEVPLHGYQSLPDRALREVLYSLNTKSGFREVAEELGLRVVPGVYCEGQRALATAVEKMLENTCGVIVKYDRSSNGYGHMVIRRKDVTLQNLYGYLDARTASFSEQPHNFTVETLMPFISVPSIEMVIDDASVRCLYPCEQRCLNSSFVGMVTPPFNLSSEIKHELLCAGRLFGEYVRDLGFRGVCDVDAGVIPDGTLYVTETNLRRTGGTYLDTLVRRLIGVDYQETHVWCADARTGAIERDFFKGWSAIRDAGLAFDPIAGRGVILTADTLAIDQKWRYLVVAPAIEEATDIEAKLEEALLLSKPI